MTENSNAAFYDRQVIISNDGSSSLYLPQLDETYHSRRGALSESEYIYIERGMIPKASEYNSANGPLKILEVGMGTGLNLLLTMRAALKSKTPTHIMSLEPFPLKTSEWKELNYGSILEMSNEYKAIHQSNWEEDAILNEFFTLHKQAVTLENAELGLLSYDVVYMDAYAPSRQAEIWSLANLEKLFASLNKGGVLVTYCAQGEFKRNLKRAGFQTSHPSGPLGKKEMSIAIK